MAKAKRKAAGGGDSKQALTIILVFFVLLTIITGVVAYYGYAEQEDLRKRRADAELKAKTFEKSRDQARYFGAFYRQVAGLEQQNKEDVSLDDAQVLGSNNFKTSFQDDLNKEIDRIKKDKYKDLNWDPNANRPAVPLVAQIAQLEKDKTDLQTKLDAEKARADQANKEKDAAITKATDDKAALMQQLQDVTGKLAEVPKQKSDELKTALELNKKLQDEKEEIQKKEVQSKEDLQKQVAALEKQLKESEAKAKTLQEKVAPINLLNHPQPKGEVASVDRATGRTAYINLGSLDRVKPNLTFAIYAKGAVPKPGVERKGSLEVVEVVGPHTSKTRITEMVSPNRDPVMAGDVLFNPAWNPALREHIAIVGNIDLSGDGSDDSAEFVRNVEKQGIIVDAYLDPKDGSVKGPGMSGETNYLVLGADIKEHHDKILELRREAAAHGVTVVPARRFLALIGYRLPPGTTPGEWTVAPVLGGAPAAKPLENPPAEKPAPEKPPEGK